MTDQQKLINTWKEYYKGRRGIPLSREISDAELLEELAIMALKNNDFSNPFIVRQHARLDLPHLKKRQN